MTTSRLINFSRLNQGPLLRDFVSLEITVKLDLLDSTDLQMRYALEKQLLALNRLDDTINAEGFPSELSKVLGTVEHIRQLATSQVGAAPESYLSGLFFCAVARIVAFDPNVRHTRRELVPFAHSLLMAAMLCEKLGSSSESSGQLSADVFNRLWIDELNKKVWSLGQSIDVTPQEFEILKYLYERAGQLCSREAIIKEALGEEYGHVATETSRLNSAMSRLRQKIELDPENPRFIVTERGYGYKLMV